MLGTQRFGDSRDIPSQIGYRIFLQTYKAKSDNQAHAWQFGKCRQDHLWIAICAYLILAKVKALYDSPYSITEIGSLVKVYALVKTDLKTLVTTPQPLIQNQDFKGLTLFDNF